MQCDRRTSGLGRELGDLCLNGVVDHIEAVADRDERQELRRPSLGEGKCNETNRAHDATPAYQREKGDVPEHRFDGECVEDATDRHARNDEAGLANAAGALSFEHCREIGEDAENGHAFDEYRRVADDGARIGQDATIVCGDAFDCDWSALGASRWMKTAERHDESHDTCRNCYGQHHAPARLARYHPGTDGPGELSGQDRRQDARQCNLSILHVEPVTDRCKAQGNDAPGCEARQNARDEENLDRWGERCCNRTGRQQRQAYFDHARFAERIAERADDGLPQSARERESRREESCGSDVSG